MEVSSNCRHAADALPVKEKKKEPGELDVQTHIASTENPLPVKATVPEIAAREAVPLGLHACDWHIHAFFADILICGQQWLLQRLHPSRASGSGTPRPKQGAQPQICQLSKQTSLSPRIPDPSKSSVPAQNVRTVSSELPPTLRRSRP